MRWTHFTYSEFNDLIKKDAYITLNSYGGIYTGEYAGWEMCNCDECWLHPSNEDDCPGMYLLLKVHKVGEEVLSRPLIKEFCLFYQEEPQSESEWEDFETLEIACKIIYPEGLGINKIVVV